MTVFGPSSSERKAFFAAEDFAGIAEEVERSEDPAVIAARKKVVTKLYSLHDDTLGATMRKWGLHSHWKREHLTNVFFPLPEANGGRVNYLRLGYGKPKPLVDALARRSGVYQQLASYGTYDQMAFHLVSMLQVGIEGTRWWVNFYMDDEAWLEQDNLLNKTAVPRYRDEFCHIIDNLQQAGYQLSLYMAHPERDSDVAAYPQEYLTKIAHHRHSEHPAMVSAELLLTPDDPRNDVGEIAPFLVGEFERLLPLYRFATWHPKENNYLRGV